MARVVVGNPFDNQIPVVGPTAQPVETYRRGVVERSPFAALANTLNAIERKAVPALQRQEQRMAEKELAEGQRLYQENRIAIGEAVKKGIIEEGASPYVRKGYRISQMNTLAARYTSELDAALEAKKLYTNGDPNRIESFIADFQNKFVQNNGMSDFSDAEMAEYFGINANKANEAFRASWRDKHVAYQAAQAYKAFEQETAQYTMTLFREDQTPDERAAAYGQLKGWIEKTAAERSLDGLNNKKITDTIVNGILIAAEMYNDPEIIDVLFDTKVGTAAIGSSFERQKDMLDVEYRIARNLENQATKLAKQAEAENEKLRGQIGAQVTANILSNDYDGRFVTVKINELLATNIEENVNYARTLQRFETTVNKDVIEANKIQVSADDYGSLMNELENAKDVGAALRTILAYEDAGKIGPEHARQYLSDWNTYYKPPTPKEPDDPIDPFELDFNTTSTTEGRALSDFKAAIRGNEFDFNVTAQINAMGLGRTFRITWRNAHKAAVTANNNQPLSPVQIDEVEAAVMRSMLTILGRVQSLQSDVGEIDPLARGAYITDIPD